MATRGGILTTKVRVRRRRTLVSRTPHTALRERARRASAPYSLIPQRSFPTPPLPLTLLTSLKFHNDTPVIRNVGADGLERQETSRPGNRGTRFQCDWYIHAGAHDTYMQQHMMPATAMPATGASTQQFGKRAQEQADDRSMSCLCNISLRMLD